MRFFLSLCCLFFLTASITAQPTKHLVLVSIDGLRPEFYLDERYPAPNLQYMAKHGLAARQVQGVFPSVTYPNHTTIITGVRPAQHGIFYNTPFEPEGQTGRWYWEEAGIRTRTLWDAAQDADLLTANLFWPVSVGAPVSYNLPEVWPLDREEELWAYVGERTQPEGFLQELEREASGTLNQQTFNIDYLNREARTGFMAAYLIENKKPNFLTMHLIGTDHFQHAEGREGLQVRKAVAAVDYAIGQMWEAAERAGILDSTTFIITGDHGFADIHTRLAPNVWLEKAGLLEDQTDRGDWKAAFHTTGASAFLHLRDPEDQGTVQEVKALLAKLPERQRKLFEVLDRDELDRLGAASEAALALNPVEGVHFTARTGVPEVSAANGGTHGNVPDFRNMHTGLVGYGAGLARQKRVPRMQLTDIAPLIAHLLGLELEETHGVLYPGLLEEER